MNNNVIISNLSIGTVLVGQWNKQRYRIERKLGHGANGTVYLVRNQSQIAALKISDVSTNIISEVNILKKINKVQGCNLGPILLDVDDTLYGGEQFSFYVMEYIEGTDFAAYTKKHGEEWLPLLLLQLLDRLQLLHQLGYAFGDLKPENIKIQGFPPNLRLIDVGGVTEFGKSIKEFTEFFDRGYWECGTRKADEHYDLFAVVMIVLSFSYQRTFQRRLGEGKLIIKMKIEQSNLPQHIRSFVTEIVEGKLTTAKDAHRYLLRCLNEQQFSSTTVINKSRLNTNVKQPSPKQKSVVTTKRKGKRKKSYFASITETAIIIIFFALAYSFYFLAHFS